MKRKNDSDGSLLRRERELRGWSQTEVARKIKAPGGSVVGRWERGEISPSPHYRALLCELFGRNAEQLGLLKGLSDAATPRPRSILLTLRIGTAMAAILVALASMPADVLVSTSPHPRIRNVSSASSSGQCDTKGSGVIAMTGTAFTGLRHVTTLIAADIAANVQQGTFRGRTYRWVEFYPVGGRGGIQLRWSTTGQWHYCNAVDGSRSGYADGFEATRAVPTSMDGLQVAFQECVWRNGPYTAMCTPVGT